MLTTKQKVKLRSLAMELRPIFQVGKEGLSDNLIKGLNDEHPTNSYLKLDAIRSISKRRIARIPNKEKGKIILDSNRIRLIKRHIYTYFIEDNYNIYPSNLDIINYIAYHIENS